MINNNLIFKTINRFNHHDDYNYKWRNTLAVSRVFGSNQLSAEPVGRNREWGGFQNMAQRASGCSIDVSVTESPVLFQRCAAWNCIWMLDWFEDKEEVGPQDRLLRGDGSHWWLSVALQQVDEHASSDAITAWSGSEIAYAPKLAHQGNSYISVSKLYASWLSTRNRWMYPHRHQNDRLSFPTCPRYKWLLPHLDLYWWFQRPDSSSACSKTCKSHAQKDILRHRRLHEEIYE